MPHFLSITPHAAGLFWLFDGLEASTALVLPPDGPLGMALRPGHFLTPPRCDRAGSLNLSWAESRADRAPMGLNHDSRKN